MVSGRPCLMESGKSTLMVSYRPALLSIPLTGCLLRLASQPKQLKLGLQADPLMNSVTPNQKAHVV